MSIDERAFRNAMGHFTSGVTIVTTAHDETLYGMTVASFSSLSLQPPLILVCIEQRATSRDAIARSGHFGVNILAADQSDLSSRFASRVEERFAGVQYTFGSLGSPLITGALVQLQCALHEEFPGGDHSIFVGRVIEAHVRDGEPLVYFRSGYRALGD